MIQTFFQKYFYSALFFLLVLILVTGCDKEVSRSPVESEAPKGFIYINSTPVGFTIFQNGRKTGRITPDSLPFLEAGNYSITLKRKYYKDTSVVVSLAEDEKKQILIDLLTNPSMRGKMFINSQPQGASISINDSLTNKVTPYTVGDLLPGEYSVRLKLLNHRDAELVAVVYSSQTRNYTKALRDTSFWIDFQTTNSGISTNVLTAIAVDHNNIKWIGTQDKGLIRFDEISFTNYDVTNSSIPANNINCISVDNQNRIWIGTNSGIGVFYGSWTIYNQTNSGLTSNIINSIHFNNTNAALIGTDVGLFKFDGANWTHYNDPLSRDWIKDFYIENENKIWLGTKGFGIFILENGTFTEISRTEYNYPTYTISSTSADQSGNIWFCFLTDSSGRAGVSFWNATNFSNYFPGTYLNSFRHIFIDDENNKWISTSEGFLLFNSQNLQSVFTAQNSLISSNLTISSVKDLNGNIWVTTQNGGLNKYKPPR
jgi:streptogramin lyase